jgi:hypothetical protein
VARPKRDASREERGCRQGRRNKTEAVWQEETCNHLETEAGRKEIQAGRQGNR